MNNNNLFKWRMVLKLSATFMLTIFFFTSCKKKDTSLGVNGIDQNELLNSVQIDTFSIFTSTVFEDSVITSGASIGLLGSYTDPKFGPVQAGFYTQFRLQSANPTFGADIKIDSFVLGLEYSSNKFYGDLSSQKFEVYQLNDSLGTASTYYSFTNKSISSKNLIDPNYEDIVPDPYTKTIIDTEPVNAQLRLYLDTNLARKLINESVDNATTFSSNENFLKYFKGLYIGVNNGVQASGKGAVLSFDLEDSQSKLTIYYHQGVDKKTFDLVINSSCAKYNKVDIQNPGNLIGNQSQFYAQAGKSRALIKIPGLKNLPKRAVIHEATLTLPIEYQTGSKYSPGSYVTIKTKFQGGGSSLYGLPELGIYDQYNKAFVLDLRNYVQHMVSGSRYIISVDGMNLEALIEGTDIYITPQIFNSSSDRIIFNGVNTNNKNKPKLVLKYTEF